MWLVVVPRFIFSPEFIGDLMKIPALVQGGRVEGANRDTTAEIGENCYRYFTPHRLTREIIYTKRSLIGKIGKMEDYYTLRLQYSLNIWGENVKQPNCV